ncbi:MAG: O-antigen ligase family protein, partial [Anaerolineales bacterium]|nr:O-antigen ligase family protein [Anaerolineales bacterium]
LTKNLFLTCALALLASGLGLAAILNQRAVQTFGAQQGLPAANLAPRPANLRAINLDVNDVTETKLAELNGFGWLRMSFDLGQPDKANWASAISTATARNFQIIAVLYQSHVSIPAPQPPSPQEFAKLAGQFAETYGAQIAVYQVWDEPNLYTGWWGRSPAATEYAALLQAAYTALKAADPAATVLAAALAPTAEAGPDNLSELIYLQQLYDLNAGAYFDAAAGKPYGYATSPEDKQTDPQLFNFSRLVLLRQVMERNGDAHKLLWVGGFGWNTHPDSIWGRVTPAEQTTYIQQAYARAEREWPWAGPLALNGGSDNASNPLSGFNLNSPITKSLITAPSGNYPAQNPFATYSGAWEFSELGADIPEQFANSQITLTFQGSELGLRVRRGDYRAYLYVTVDGAPANRLPQDERGAYLVLTSPTLKPELETILVADGLNPNQAHTVVIQPERGWDQWAVAGFAVGSRTPIGEFYGAVTLLLALSGLSAFGLWWWGRRLAWGRAAQTVQKLWAGLSSTVQVVITALASVALYFSAWLTFDTQITTFTRRFGDTAPILFTALTAGVLYFSPSFLVALTALAVLFVLYYLRPDIALAFITFFIPFFLFPRMLWERGASLLEFSLWLTFLAVILRSLPNLRKTQHAISLRFAPIDFGILALLLVTLASTLFAQQRAVAVYEFRTVILGASVFYLLLRVVPLDNKAIWRLVDFFVLGAVAAALIGLWQYVTGEGLIVTEEGVARIRSVYGSPNNLGLYLGRALPVALAVALVSQLPITNNRRLLYFAACAIMLITLVLTFSRGALVLGVPAALAVIVIGWQGKRGAWLVGGALVLGLLALPFIAQLPRFADLFSTQTGTGFFRLNLWVSAWRMFLDQPWLGVGPDNFLYAYRGFYILPQAWQEPNLSHPHNILFDFLSRVGLLGTLCGAWLIYHFIRQFLILNPSIPNSSRAHNFPLKLGLLALLADMLAHGLVDHSFFLVDLAFVFYWALALIQHPAVKASEVSAS